MTDEDEIPDPAHSRHLMIRILQGDGVDRDEPARIETITDDNGSNPKTIHLPKLCIDSHSTAPNFKMLLVPYRDGQELPITSWDAGHTTATIHWSDQTDTVSFTPNADGRTRLSVRRDGQEIIATK